MHSKRSTAVAVISLGAIVLALTMVLGGCGGGGPVYHDTLFVTYPTPALNVVGGMSPPYGVVTPALGAGLDTKIVIASLDGGANVTCIFSTVTGNWAYPTEITGLKRGPHTLDVVGLASFWNYTTSSVRVNFTSS
jgi:hypothetical protein